MGGVGWQISGDFRKLRKVEGAGGGGRQELLLESPRASQRLKKQSRRVSV